MLNLQRGQILLQGSLTQRTCTPMVGEQLGAGRLGLVSCLTSPGWHGSSRQRAFGSFPSSDPQRCLLLLQAV